MVAVCSRDVPSRYLAAMPFVEADYKAALRKIFDAIDSLTRMHGGRHQFTIDGRLVGDIGEIIAAHFYDLTLDVKSRKTHDAVAVIDGAQRNVSIKATFKESLTFTAVPDLVLGLKLYSDGKFEEVFNGPGSMIRDNYAHRKSIGEKQLSFSNNNLCKLSKTVQANQKVQLKARPTRSQAC